MNPTHDAPHPTHPAIHPGWRGAFLTLALALTLVAIGFWEGFASMVDVWLTAETYTHGFFIAPLSLYLIARRRAHWLPLAPRPFWAMLPVMGLIGLGWWAARTVDLTGGLHACAVLMVIATIAFVVGKKVSRVWAFPLLYLLFAIPFGEFLLPYLMAFTADFTVTALQLVGIPVFREGLFFILPSGNWSVVEACSGLRYLISSLALGSLYAYLSYRSWIKRTVFITVSAIVPLFANGMRAFFIVVLGHVSDMRLATGVDHFIYGWVFFLVVIFALFWIGNRWREDTDTPADNVIRHGEIGDSVGIRAWAMVWAALLIATAWGPMAAQWTQGQIQTALPRADFSAWESFAHSPRPFSDFHPAFKGARLSWSREFEDHGRNVGLFAGYYLGQDAAKHKLISVTNKLVTTLQHRDWGVVQERVRRVANDTVIESEIRGPNEARLLVWHWYNVCGHTTTSQVWAKWLQWRCVVTSMRDDASVMVLYTPIDSNTERARDYLHAFLARHKATLRQAVEGTRQRTS